MELPGRMWLSNQRLGAMAHITRLLQMLILSQRIMTLSIRVSCNACYDAYEIIKPQQNFICTMQLARRTWHIRPPSCLMFASI
jgi:hypothetical protein